MASLIPGYEYDIFISYRQKDNKYDGWVTEFVDNLKREIEATFKEEVSVYFDINPHDGLLETHDVDASLKEKLRCLVFIPIISRTYCDPKSFAWEHEFKAFVEVASKDQFGLKVKLPNGNVANRVLPVRIHDLDTTDIKLCESVLGGVLRGVEFIYKEPGVNKPLTAEDDEKKNLNKTKYRIQINKIANAIKEIISGLMAGEVVSGKEKPETQLPWEEAKKGTRIIPKEKQPNLNKRKVLLYIISAASILMFLGVFVYPKIFKSNTLEKLRSSGERISVAVMPFQNMTNDTTFNFWQEWIQTSLILALSKASELKVRQKDILSTVLQTKGVSEYASISTALAKSVSEKVDADIHIYGSIKKTGPKLRVEALLIDTKTSDVLKPFEIDAPADENAISVITDSLRKEITDFLLLSRILKKYPLEAWMTLTTNSPEAYKYWIYGNKAREKFDFPSARNWYLKALVIDSNYFDASFNLLQSGSEDENLQMLLKLYKKRDQMPVIQQVWVNYMYAEKFESPDEQIKCLRQIQLLDDQNPNVLLMIGNLYRALKQYDKAIDEYKNTIELCNKLGIQYDLPFLPYAAMGETYHSMGQYTEAVKIYKLAEQIIPDRSSISYSWIIRDQACLSLTEKDTVAANQYIAKYINICKENSTSEADIATGLAQAYRDAGILDKSERYFRKAFSLEPENLYRMNRLAWFLIDKAINLNEGLELIGKALKLCQDKYTYFRLMDTKGWGLYKQGKYNEALDLFEKIWEQRPKYDYDVYSHFEEVKMAVVGQK